MDDRFRKRMLVHTSGKSGYGLAKPKTYSVGKGSSWQNVALLGGLLVVTAVVFIVFGADILRMIW